MHCSQTTPFILAYRFGHPQSKSLTTSTAEFTAVTKSHTTFWRDQQFRILQQFVFRFN